MTINTLWVAPDVEPGQPARPQPKPGAAISYNIVQDRMSIANVADGLSGTFLCDYDLTNGSLFSESQTGNCANELTRITDLIDAHLASPLP